MDPTIPILPVALPKTVSPQPASGVRDETAVRAHIAKAGKDYESAFLSIMFGQMMSGVKTSTFGGGEGEDMFKSFMTDALAKSMVRHGGVGLAKILSADMLKLQGLGAAPAAASPPASQSGPTNASTTAQNLDIAA